MKKTYLIAVMAGLVAVGVFAADASAFYHPSTGMFASRDPGPGGAMRIGAGGLAAAGGFLLRDPTGQYRDGMHLYQYVGSNPTGYVDPRGTDRWVVGGLHDEVVYPIYDDKCCPVKYRQCGFFAAGWLGSGWQTAGAAVGAALWQVDAKVICQEVPKPAGAPTFTSSCKADQYLHTLMQAMEGNAGKYRLGHNSRVWTNAVEEYGIKTNQYEQWAASDRAMAAMYDAWAQYDDSTGQSDRAAYNRKQAQKYRDQAAYNDRKASEILQHEAEAAYGGHCPFWAGSETVWD